MTPTPINAIIFDLGNVIVKVNHELTYSALEKISNKPREELKQIFTHESYFSFELGLISEQEFFSKICTLLSIQENITPIAEAWDAMIVGIPPESILLLNDLKEQFPIYALSNTNFSHIKAINKHLLNHHKIKTIHDLFNKIYFSCELNLDKPHKQIFEHVLQDSSLQSCNTLFIDDNAQNINTAREMGFQTIHLTDQSKLITELKNLGISLRGQRS